MNFRNAVFNRAGTIDCEVEHPVYGWIPFTASPDDPEEHGREIYARALEADPAPYVAPPEPPPLAPTEIPLTRAQFEWLLAYTGLDDTWSAVEAAAREADRALYADLRLERQRSVFRFDAAMAFIERVAEYIPAGADTSEETIAAAWGRALQAS